MPIAPNLIGHDQIRIGYIGCGYMAQAVHLPNLAMIPGCQVVALAELRQDLGRKVQQRYGIPQLYRDHHELIANPEIDAVALSGAFAIQGEIARDCLAAGKHVFMEKPMAVSLAQAERLLAAGESSGARLMVGYMKRYDSGNRLARQTIATWRSSGEAGQITFARAHGFGGNWTGGLEAQLETSQEPMPIAPIEAFLPDWLPGQYVNQYVGYLQQFTHNINLLRFLLDAGDAMQVRHVDLGPDGYTGVVLLDVNGTRASLETGRLEYYRWDEHTQIYFERGWVHTWAPPLLHRNAVAEVEIYQAGNPANLTRPVAEPRWTWAYKRELEYFLHALRTGEPFESSGTDTLTDVRIFETIFRHWLNR